MPLVRIDLAQEHPAGNERRDIGQVIYEAMRATHERGPRAGAFERFFLEAARTAYPAGGFTADQNFSYGATVDLIER